MAHPDDVITFGKRMRAQGARKNSQRWQLVRGFFGEHFVDFQQALFRLFIQVS